MSLYFWFFLRVNISPYKAMTAYQTNDGCSQSNERADRNYDQGQFPTLVKSQQEPTDACGHALNENGHLVSNGIIDFINITRNKRGFDHYNGIGQFKCLTEKSQSFPSKHFYLCTPLLLGNMTDYHIWKNLLQLGRSSSLFFHSQKFVLNPVFPTGVH